MGGFRAPPPRRALDAQRRRDAYSTTQPQIEVALERNRLAERGISVQTLLSALQGGLGGVQARELRETDRRTPIRVRFAGNANEDLLVALATPIRGVPISNLVTWKEVRAPIEVVRVNQRPVSIVEGLIERGGTARASVDVQAQLSELEPPAGLTWAVTGADVEQRRTTEQLALVALLSVALVFLVLAGEFASFTIPLVVMITVPLAAAGGFVLLALTGQSINAVSLIGIVVMIGMADNEAVVKLDAIRRFREMGHSIHDAVLLGGRQRLRALPAARGGGDRRRDLGAARHLLPAGGGVRGDGEAEGAPVIRWAVSRPAVVWAAGVRNRFTQRLTNRHRIAYGEA